MHQSQPLDRPFLTALEVQELLHIDRSTVYRMADDGRLPSIRVGRARRFPAAQIAALAAGDAARSPATGTEPLATPGQPAGTSAGAGSAQPRAAAGNPHQVGTQLPPGAPPREVAQAAIDVASELLGVMMVVTDMSGNPITDVANPCPWFVANSAVEGVLDQCVAEWRVLADNPDFTPRFATGAVGFQCARTFLRSGSTLVGMVLAGGISPAAEDTIDPDLYHLDTAARQRVLNALPRIAAAISSPAPHLADAMHKEN